MNDYIIFGTGILLGTVMLKFFKWCRSAVTARATEREVQLSLMRLDAELRGIKTLLKDTDKQAETQLLNDQLERDLGENTPPL